MFSGKYDLTMHNNRIFIDRDGQAFTNLVNYLRTGKFPIFSDKQEEQAFFEELSFWKIPLVDIGIIFQNLTFLEKNQINQLQFDENWCANTLTLENNSTVVRKYSKKTLTPLDIQHGIVFCKTSLDIFNPYIEFKVSMNIPSRGKSHLFIGLVDKSKYRKENLGKFLYF